MLPWLSLQVSNLTLEHIALQREFADASAVVKEKERDFHEKERQRLELEEEVSKSEEEVRGTWRVLLLNRAWLRGDSPEPSSLKAHFSKVKPG